ncbi:MAG TPA: PAS domain S-box protein [Rhizomicrobium sp.]
MSEDEDRQRAVRLKRIRTQFDLAERAAHIGHWRYDLTDEVYYWSPGLYRLLGEDPNTRRPDPEWLFTQMTAESRRVIEAALADAIRTRSPFSYRTFAKDASRAAQIVDTQGEVEVDEDGRAVSLLAVCRDVTAQVRAEEARENAQAMYRLMTEESGDIIILYSTDARLVFVSNALERITGRTEDEIRDGGYKRFIHPADHTEAEKMIRRPLHADTVTATWRILHRDGHYVWLETTIRTVFDPATGEPRNVISVSRDVSARVEAEQARRKADEMYRVMTTEASDIIMLFAPDRRILFASEALGRVVGRTPQEIEFGNWMRLVHPDDLPELSKLELPPRARETHVMSFRIARPDGRYVWLEVMTRARYAPDGAYLGYISAARDISERKQHELETKQAQARAEAANVAKSKFLANMSHELRTPLNAIIGFADLMKSQAFGPLGNSRYESYATLIYDSGQLLLDLITDMLDMAKIEAGKFELNFERVDLMETIDDVVRLLRDRAHMAGLALIAETAGRASLVADRRAMKQILLNLVSNAIKFTPSGGEVRIAATVEDGFARLTVTDTGIGIPQDQIARLGRPFEQVCDDPKLAKAGTGLGLALVRALSELHGGALAITSEEGVGTEVNVTFALKPAARAAA